MAFTSWYNAQLKQKLITCHTTRHGGTWGERHSSYSFLTSALYGGEWSASRPGRALPPGKGHPVPIVQEAGWAPRAGLDTEARGKIILALPGIEPRSLGRPVGSQTLYWLSYPRPYYAQLDKNSRIYGTRRFSTMVTIAHHRLLSASVKK
jgi:hypothetical protein